MLADHAIAYFVARKKDSYLICRQAINARALPLKPEHTCRQATITFYQNHNTAEVISR
jgi:hypothetical protein